MPRTQRIFRVVWRINAILILFAVAGIGVVLANLFVTELGWGSARRRADEAKPKVGELQSGERLFLGAVSLVPGTTVLRGQLQAQRSGGGFKSGPSSYGGGYAEVRNILYVADGANVGRWLLPDNDHVITEQHDVIPDKGESAQRVPVATVALVKPAGADLQLAEGALLLLDPAGEKVQTVAEGVRDLHTATIEAAGVLLLFERRGKYVLAVYQIATLAKKEERELEVPQLK